MTIVDMVAKEFHLHPAELLKESLRVYLHQRLSRIEADIFILSLIHI